MKTWLVVPITVAIAVIGLVTSLSPSSARAAYTGRITTTNPAGICQSALPAFDGVIRKRPKAVANEGASSAFITCAWTSQGSTAGLIVFFGSLDGAPKPISCTAVPGRATDTDLASVTRSVSAYSGGGSFIIWPTSDFNNVPIALISISCSLPPNSAIYDSRLYFSEEIGS